MKRYIKLFEEFLNEEDPLAALMGGGEEGKDGKAKEDPVDAEKKKISREKKRAKEQAEKVVDKGIDRVKALLKKHEDLPQSLVDEIISALNSKDRVEIHNAMNHIIYQQQNYAKSGNDNGVSDLTGVKVELEKLDKSYTNNKII